MHVLSGRRRWTIFGLVSVLLVAGGVGLVFHRSQPKRYLPGPLASVASNPGWWYRVGGRMNPGDVFAYAGPTLTNRTDQPAVIDEVVAMGLPASVRVVRETTLFPPSFSNGPYPFTGVNARFRDAAFEPLVGSIVPAGTSQSPGLREIVFFVTPTEPGVYLTQGLWISYHVGAEHYRYFEPSQWGLCALPATCPAWT